MALQIRRGPTANRTGFTPKIGELIYDTDEKSVYVGDGTTVGGIPVTSLTSEEIQDIIAPLLVNGNHTGISFEYNDVSNTIDADVTVTQYTNDMAKAAAGAALSGGTHNNVTFAYDSENKVINANVTTLSVEQVQDIVAALFQNGVQSNISFTYTDDDSVPKINTTVAPTFTDEQAQDAAAMLFDNGTHTGITFTYNDETGYIDVTVTAEGISYNDEQAQDAAAALFTNGVHSGITFQYDDNDSVPKINASVTIDEQSIKAAAASTLTDNSKHSNITFSYDSLTEKLSATVTLDGSGITEEQAIDAAGTMIANGNYTGISFSYDANTNALTGVVSDNTEDIQDIVGALFQNGNHDAQISVVYGDDDSVPKISIGLSDPIPTVSDIQDVVGNLLTNGTNSGITFSYNPISNTITSTVAVTTGDIQDIAAGILVNGSNSGITFSYDTNSNLLTSSVTLPTADIQDVVGNLLTNSVNTGISFSYDTNTNTLTSTISSSLSDNLDLFGNDITGTGAIDIIGSIDTTGNISTESALTAFQVNSDNYYATGLQGRFDFFTTLGTGIGLNTAGGTLASKVAVSAGDYIGSYSARGWDGTKYLEAAGLTIQLDPTANLTFDYPRANFEFFAGDNSNTSFVSIGKLSYDGNFKAASLTTTGFAGSGAYPSSPVEGTIIFDTSTKHFMGYTGSVGGWKQLDN